jgi:DNA-binding beta-propeller fold protein YncE
MTLDRKGGIPRRMTWTAAAALASILCLGASAPAARAASGFGLLSGPSGCLVAPGKSSSETTACGVGKGLAAPNAVAVSPDGANVYVASGHNSGQIQSSFGSIAILKRDPTGRTDATPPLAPAS